MTKRYHHNWIVYLEPCLLDISLTCFFLFSFFSIDLLRLFFSFFSRYIGSRLIANFGTFYLPSYPTQVLDYSLWEIWDALDPLILHILSIMLTNVSVQPCTFICFFSLFSCNAVMKAVVLCHIHRNHARALFLGFCYALACSIAAAAISPCYMASCCLQGVIAAGRYLELGTIILRISLLTGIIFSFLQHPICIAQILNCHYRKYSANNISEVCSL